MKLFTIRNTFAIFENHLLGQDGPPASYAPCARPSPQLPQTFCYLNDAMCALSEAVSEVLESKYHARFDGSEQNLLVQPPSAIAPKERAWEQALFDQAVEWSARNGLAATDEGAWLPLDEIEEACKTGFVIELNFAANDPLRVVELCFPDLGLDAFACDSKFERFIAEVERQWMDNGLELEVIHAGEGGRKVGVGFNGEMLLEIGEDNGDGCGKPIAWLEKRAAAVIAGLNKWMNSDDPRRGYGGEVDPAVFLNKGSGPRPPSTPMRKPALRPTMRSGKRTPPANSAAWRMPNGRRRLPPWKP